MYKNLPCTVVQVPRSEVFERRQDKLWKTQDLVYNRCPGVHLVSWYTTDVLVYIWCPGVQLVSCCTTCVLLYNQCPGVQLVSWCTTGILEYNWCPGVQAMYWCTVVVLVYTGVLVYKRRPGVQACPGVHPIGGRLFVDNLVCLTSKCQQRLQKTYTLNARRQRASTNRPKG